MSGRGLRGEDGRVKFLIVLPQEQTSHVSTPAWLSKSLLQLNTLFIRSGIYMLTGSHGGTRSSQSHTLLLLLLNWRVELGSSSCGHHSPYRV